MDKDEPLLPSTSQPSEPYEPNLLQSQSLPVFQGLVTSHLNLASAPNPHQAQSKILSNFSAEIIFYENILLTLFLLSIAFAVWIGDSTCDQPLAAWNCLMIVAYLIHQTGNAIEKTKEIKYFRVGAVAGLIVLWLIGQYFLYQVEKCDGAISSLAFGLTILGGAGVALIGYLLHFHPNRLANT